MELLGAERNLCQKVTRMDAIELENAVTGPRRSAAWCNARRMGRPSAICRRRRIAVVRNNQDRRSRSGALAGGDRPLQVFVLWMSRVIAGPMCGRTWQSTVRTSCVSVVRVSCADALVIDTGFEACGGTRYRSSDGKDTLQDLVKSADVFSQDTARNNCR